MPEVLINNHFISPKYQKVRIIGEGSFSRVIIDENEIVCTEWRLVHEAGNVPVLQLSVPCTNDLSVELKEKSET